MTIYQLCKVSTKVQTMEYTVIINYINRDLFEKACELSFFVVVSSDGTMTFSCVNSQQLARLAILLAQFE